MHECSRVVERKKSAVNCYLSNIPVTPDSSASRDMHASRSFAVLFTVSALVGCASVSSLPATPQEVKLDPGRFEQGYWPRYTASTVLRGFTTAQALDAARSALKASGFRIVRDDPAKLVVMGERGATLFYWNVVAGVYLVPQGSDVAINVVSVGSKDIGFIELQQNPFPAEIIKNLEQAQHAK